MRNLENIKLLTLSGASYHFFGILLELSRRMHGRDRGSVVALNGDVSEGDKRIAPWGIRQRREGGNGFIRFLLGALTRPLQRATGRHCFQNRFQQVSPVTLLNRAANQQCLFRVPLRIACSSGSVGLPSLRSSPTFLPSVSPSAL